MTKQEYTNYQNSRTAKSPMGIVHYTISATPPDFYFSAIDVFKCLGYKSKSSYYRLIKKYCKPVIFWWNYGNMKFINARDVRQICEHCSLPNTSKVKEWLGYSGIYPQDHMFPDYEKFPEDYIPYF